MIFISASSVCIQIVLYKCLQKFVPVDVADNAPGVVVSCDVGRILGKDVAHYLIDRIIALFLESIV